MTTDIKTPEDQPQNKGWFARFLATVEWLGNLLPHPITLFALFCLFIVLFSGFAAWLGGIEPFLLHDHDQRQLAGRHRAVAHDGRIAADDRHRADAGAGFQTERFGA